MERIILILLACLALTGCKTAPAIKDDLPSTPEPTTVIEEEVIAEDTQCDDKACVALYLDTYHELPSNYMTKKEARKYGWESGALHLVVEGKCIGGDSFGNFEGNLPEGQQYYECDIDTLHSSKRGTKRIVYSEGDDIWYTEDHYETFELLYGDGE